MLNQNTKDTVKNLSFFLKNNFRKNTDLNLPHLIFQKFIENDNKKIISILMRCLYIYQKHLKIKKLKYFYQFYQKSIKKEKINIKNIQQRLFDDLQKRKQSKKNLEKKFNEEEEKICTFSPKINNDKFNIKYLNDPIIIVPATSRVYNLSYKKNIFDFEKLLNNFIEKSSTINVDKDYKEKDNYKSNDLLEKENKLSLDNYSTKNTFYKNTRTIPLLNNRNLKNKRKIKYSSSSCSASTSRTSRTTLSRGARSTARRIAAPRAYISATGSCRCYPRNSATASAPSSRTKTVSRFPYFSLSTKTAKSSSARSRSR